MFDGPDETPIVPRSAVVLTAVVLAVFLASVVSLETESYPARWFIERQAGWGDGTYGVGFTFLVTSFTLLVPIGGLVLGLAGLGAWRDRGHPGPPPEAAGGVRQRRVVSVVVGAILLAAGVGVGALAADPVTLAPLGDGATWLLVVIPFGPLFGMALLVDNVVPPQLHEGPPTVEAPDERGNIFVRVGGCRFAVRPEVAADLARRSVVRVVVSPVLGRLLWRG